MTQEERWMTRYNEVVSFIETNHRNPSRHKIEEHDHLNWLKADGRGPLYKRHPKQLSAYTLSPKELAADT